MRSGVWPWFVAGLAFSACSGGYPLEPTSCDRYCHVTHDLQCDYYDPAGCVRRCESERKGDPACADQMSATVTCFEGSSAALNAQCSMFGYVSGGICDQQREALEQCTSAFFQFPWEPAP